MKLKDNKTLKRVIGVISVLSICFMLITVPGSVLSAPGVIGDNYFAINDTFNNQDDWALWYKTEGCTLNSVGSYVTIPGNNHISYNITDSYMENYTYYIRFMVTAYQQGGSSGHVLFSIYDTDIDDARYGVASVQLQAVTSGPIPLTIPYYGVFGYVNISEWYELTIEVFEEKYYTVLLYDMADIIGSVNNVSMSSEYLEWPIEDSGYYPEIWFNCGDAYGQWSSGYPLRIDAIRMWYDDPGEEPSILPQDETLGKSIWNFVFFLPIMVLTWTIGKGGFIIGTGLMAFVWMFTQTDFIWEGIMMFGVIGIYIMKEGFN